MEKWKSIFKVFFAAIILVSVSANTIIAYLADMDSASNAMTIGGNNITIEEEFDSDPIHPGAVITKKVRILNDGPNDCFVRVRAVFSDSSVGQYAEIDWNETDWIYNPMDEYYYYKLAIAKNAYTSYLMTSIQIDEDIPENRIKDVDFIVYAESYQADGFLTYQDAWADYKVNIK